MAEKTGFIIEVFSTADNFLDSVAKAKPVGVLINHVMAETDAVEIIRKLSNQQYHGKVCIVSELTDQKLMTTTFRLGSSYGLDMVLPLQMPLDKEAFANRLDTWWKSNYTVTVNDVKHAISNGEMKLHYQPKVHIGVTEGRGHIDEVEALARWIHPERGIISPGVFIPLVEQHGLIGSFTDAIIAEALTQMNHWKAAGDELTVGINLSLLSLCDLSLPDKLAADCGNAGIETNKLVLEITETAAMGSSLDVPDILTRLRIKGFELAMDDFGTGYSSLVQLYRLPFSELKIDQSFLKDCDSDDEAKIIIQSIQDLATNLDLSTCAEGVETAATMDFCRNIGCDKIQGYFISKPVAAEELIRFIKYWDSDLEFLTASTGE